MTKWILCLVVSCSLQIRAGVLFDGVDDFIAGTDIAAMDSLSAYTLSVWVRATAIQTAKCVVCKDDLTVGPFLQTDTVNSNQLTFALAAASGIKTTNANLVSNTWYCVVGTFDNALGTSKTKLYLNGVALGTTNFGTPDSITSTGASTASWEIGRLGAVGRYWFGDIDDVRVYNRAVTASEAQSIYESRLKKGGVIFGLIWYSTMSNQPGGDSADGDSVMDIIGGLNGTGDNGANNTGLTWTDDTVMSYPTRIRVGAFINPFGWFWRMSKWR